VRQRLDAPVRAPQRDPARGREQHAVERLDAAAAHLIHADRAVDVLLQQLLRVHQIELEILLDDAGTRSVGQRFERHSGGIDQGGDVGEAQRVAAAHQL
jgi:hypothetical protein